MRVIAEQIVDGVAERDFELEVAGDRVPGVLWVSLPGRRRHTRLTNAVRCGQCRCVHMLQP
jgi:hypothetical protein